MTAPPPGRTPRKKPMTVPRRMAQIESAQSFKIGQEVFDLRFEDGPLHGLFHVEQNLGDPKKAHDHGDEADSVAELDDVPGKSRSAHQRVHPDAAQKEAESGHEQGLPHRARWPKR